MKPADEGGSRIAIIFNGSPLSNGDCGSGESEIRRWILENDWLDCIIMLPDQLFYNTGIFSYIWSLTNKKPRMHKGRIMIIDARKQFDKEPKSFGNKRNRLLDEHRSWVEERYRNGWKDNSSDECVKVFNTKDFAFHKVSVVFWQTDEHDKPGIVTEPFDKPLTPANVRKAQEFYAVDTELDLKVTGDGKTKQLKLALKPKDSFTDKFEAALSQAFKMEKPDKTELKEFIRNLTVEAQWTHPDYVEDDEYIPYGENIEDFLKREIAKPIIRWHDNPQLGYEILPNKYFYKYVPPAPADELLRKFQDLDHEAIRLIQSLGK